MTFALDPEFAAALAPNAEAMAESTPPPVGDVKTRRATFEAIIVSANAVQPTLQDVTTTDFRTVSSDGATVPLHWCAKEGASSGSAALYLHGGGMIVGNFGLFDAPAWVVTRANTLAEWRGWTPFVSLQVPFFSERHSRVLDNPGYATLMRRRLYAEEGLAGKEADLWLWTRP
jgi:hypothetical protein